jgi:CRISPR-associated protein Csm4
MHFEYSIFRLNFTTPVRFGNGKGASGLDTRKISLSSDSLFSAVFSEYISFFGEEASNKLVSSFGKGETAISSLLPWKITEKGFSYYIPKPIFPSLKKVGEDNVKKQLKKIKFISMSNISRYIDFINGKTGLGNEKDWDLEIGAELLTDRVNLKGDKPEPYRVASYRFVDGAGLYFIIRYTDKNMFDSFKKVVKLLGISGIGGKVSSGMGKYTLEICNMDGEGEEKLLYDMLENEKANVQMLMGAYHPKEEEIENLKQDGYTYILENRDGFCTSPHFSSANGALKRKSCTMVAEGSCFAKRLEGEILDLSYGDFHKVYRLGKTLFVGVSL